jgi:hypothetical protein
MRAIRMCDVVEMPGNDEVTQVVVHSIFLWFADGIGLNGQLSIPRTLSTRATFYIRDLMLQI